jgi:putative Ca2+/H+ antiporter (TMEM165/GDT1 family)
MDWQFFWITFGTVFLAEMGDKTQIATLILTAEKGTPWTVLAGACAALCFGSFLVVLLGGVMAQYVPPTVIKKAAGIVFVVIGALVLLGKW